MPMSRHPFEMVTLPQARSTQKPRRTGITMMMDWGIPLGRLDDLLGLIGPYVDLGQLVVGTSRLYEEDYYRAKLDLYHKYQVKPFIGGQFLEYVFATQGWSGVEPYCAEAKRFGSSEEHTSALQSLMRISFAVFCLKIKK